LEQKIESVNAGDVVIVDHDLENISNFALTKSHIVLRVSYFQLLPIQITPKFDVFSLTFALRLYLYLNTYGIGKNNPLDVF
jgi:hypothetical protein